MNILTKWQLGTKALALASLASQFVRSADLGTLLSVLLKIVELERDVDADGKTKFGELFAWFVAQWPKYQEAAYMLRDFATAAVALFKAVSLFRARSA
jgi:hypothetical protein